VNGDKLTTSHLRPRRGAFLPALSGLVVLAAWLGTAAPAPAATAGPTITVYYPQNSTTITTETPLIQASIIDAAHGVNRAKIVLTLDSKSVTNFNFDTTSGMLSYLVTPALSQNTHTLQISAADNSGNTTTTPVVNFRVVLPTLDAGLHLFSYPYYFTAGSFPSPEALFGLSGGASVSRWVPTDSQYHQ